MPKKVNPAEAERDMYELVLYMDKYPSVQSVKDICVRYRTIKKYLIARHDKDTAEDGTPKKPHYHVLVKLASSQKSTMIVKWFDANINQLCLIKGGWNNAVCYSVHKNAEGKYQYGYDALTGNFDYKTIIESYSAKVSIQSLCNAVMVGDMSIYEAKKKVVASGCYDKMSAQLDAAYKLYASTYKGKRNLEVCFVFGASGTGKTRFCIQHCERNNIDYFVSSSGNDALDSYLSQPCIIFDDARSDMFSFEDWLKLLDNYTLSSIKSRYCNKLVVAKYIFITTPFHPLEFFNEFTAEDRWQFYRRVNGYQMMTKDTVYVYGPMKVDENGDYVMGDCIYSQPNVYSMEPRTETISNGMLQGICDTWRDISAGKLPYDGTQLSLFGGGGDGE